MRKRILVVSDDPILGYSRVALLKKAGYQAESIASDNAAMDLLEVERFDLVLLGRDTLLPGRGLDRRLRERHPDLLTLKIEGNVPVPSIYPSRIVDARPERVLEALEEMLLHPPNSAKAPSRAYKPNRS
jgi:DNA-binding NtrC family response regulator